MNWIDIVLIVAIVIPTLVGLKNGLIKTAFSLAGLIIGVVLAGRYYVPLAERLAFIPHEGAAKIVAFVIILVAVVVIAIWLAKLLKMLTKMMLLGWLNRLGGAVLGFLLGAIVCGAALAIWVKFLGIGETIADSNLANFLLDFFPLVLGLLPAEFDSVRSFFQ